MLLWFLLPFLCHASDKFCAWNRAIQPPQSPDSGTTDNALSYNFINGEFNRDTSFSTGDVWHGVPYFKQTLESCYVTTLWMYRYMDWNSWPPSAQWVIGANMGIAPEYSYAYCIADDQATPSGGCDGQWMIGNPRDDSIGQTAAHVLDSNFNVRVGGCPQVTCATMEFQGTEDWAGTYEYYKPNQYIQRNAQNTVSGEWYLFFNPKAWTWAAHEYIEDYKVCEQYRYGVGFTAVANVRTGADTESIPVPGGALSWRTPIGSQRRIITCTGTVDTPAPVAAVSWEPTVAPVAQADFICEGGWCKLGGNQTTQERQIAELLAMCGCMEYMASCDPPLCTDPPTVSARLSSSPTPKPTANPTRSPLPNGVTRDPSPSPTRSPLTNGQTHTPTKSPQSSGTSKPTKSPGSSGNGSTDTANQLYVWIALAMSVWMACMQ